MIGGPEPCIAIARAAPLQPHAYDLILHWIKQQHPSLVPLFALTNLPCGPVRWPGIRLLVPWIQDPSEYVYRDVHDCLVRLGRECDEQGIRVVNRAETQQNLTKLETSRRLREAGIFTPRVYPIRTREEFLSNFCGLAFPLVVRENQSHQGPLFLVEGPDQAAAIPYEELFEPVAAEYIEVGDATDGRYRKYRAVVIGDRVVSHHLQTSVAWLTRGAARVKDLQSREEEIAYLISPDPFEESMRQVGVALGADYLGIDYGVDPSGNLVVWEANYYPYLHFSRFDLVYRNFAMERTIAAMVLTYLEWAGVDPPGRLVRQAGYED